MQTNSTYNLKSSSGGKHKGREILSVKIYRIQRQKTKAHRKHIKVVLIVKLHFDLYT